jgi:hypothetical protein
VYWRQYSLISTSSIFLTIPLVTFFPLSISSSSLPRPGRRRGMTVELSICPCSSPHDRPVDRCFTHNAPAHRPPLRFTKAERKKETRKKEDAFDRRIFANSIIMVEKKCQVRADRRGGQQIRRRDWTPAIVPVYYFDLFVEEKMVIEKWKDRGKRINGRKQESAKNPCRQKKRIDKKSLAYKYKYYN